MHRLIAGFATTVFAAMYEKRIRCMTIPATSATIRARLVETFRRDLIGPGPDSDDADLATERLNENPSRWYLAGFLAPADDPLAQDGPKGEEEQAAIEDDAETEVTEPADDG